MPETITCTPEALTAASECYKEISPGDRDAVQIYLLNVISGLNLTPAQLASASVCYAQQIDKQLQLGVIIYLLCQIAATEQGQ